ncbi:MAG: hypothetical protein JWO72_3276 [Caulobacteraceae bacterium]|nr:hypothetical protein [Caulobacteraceae bacterium]
MAKIDDQTSRWAARTALLVFAGSAGLMGVAWLPWPAFSDIETLLVFRALLALLSILGASAGILLLVARGLLLLGAARRN